MSRFASLFFIISVFLLFPQESYAATSCSFVGGQITLLNDTFDSKESPEYKLDFNLDDNASRALQGKSVFLETGGGVRGSSAFSASTNISSNSFSIPIDQSLTDYQKFTDVGEHEISVHQASTSDPNQNPLLCRVKYTISPIGGTCEFDYTNNVVEINLNLNKCKFGYIPAQIMNLPDPRPKCECKPPGDKDAVPAALGGNIDSQFCKVDVNIDNLPLCSKLKAQGLIEAAQARTCTKSSKIGFQCQKDNQVLCMNTDGSTRDPNNILCMNITTSAGGTRCNVKTGQPEELGEGILTAIGCVPSQPKPLVEGLMKFVVFASGGIALLLMIFGAFRWILSEGNAENIKKAQDQFLNAFIGLLFIIFSVLFLQIISVDILGIPGFSS